MQTKHRLLLMAALTAVSLSTSAATLGYWRFEDGLNLGADSSGAGRTLIPTNAPASWGLDTNGAPGWSFSKTIPQSGAINTLGVLLDYLPGTINSTSYLYAANAGFAVSTQMTIEVFFNARKFPGNSLALASQLNDPNGQRCWNFTLRDTATPGGQNFTLRFGSSRDGTTARTVGINSTFTGLKTNTDYYAAAVYSNGVVTFYLANLSTNNPALYSSTVSGAEPNIFSSATIPFRIGASANGPSTMLPFSGLLDEVRLSDRALAVGELLFSANATSPRIDTPPQNQTVEVHSNATFSVGAAGQPPLSYQWYLGASSISDATNTTLIVSNASLAQSGNSYSVVVTNTSGSVTSAPATLTVVDTTVPTIGYWRFENGGQLGFDSSSNALHLSNTGATENITDAGPGEFFSKTIGLTGLTNIGGLLLDGSNHLSRADELAFLVRTQLTIEAFFNLSSISNDTTIPIASQYGDAGNQKSWVLGVREDLADAGLGNLRLRFAISPAGDGTGQVVSNATRWVLQTNHDYYAAVVYDRGTVTIYLADLAAPVVALESQVMTGFPASVFNSSSDFRIGAMQSGSAGSYLRFPGLLDEVRLSRVALPPDQLLVSGSMGIAPLITLQPRSQTNQLGSNTTLSVTALGSAPLTYLWSKDGVPVGSNSPSLDLPNLQTNDAGNYQVVVTNQFGMASSLVASLTLMNRPPIATNPNAQVRQGMVLEIALDKLLQRASDPDGDPLSIISAGPTSTNGGTVTLGTTNILYQPVMNFVGVDQFSYTLSDGRGGTAIGLVTVNVISSNTPSLNIVSPPSVLPNGHFHVGFAGVPGYSYTVQQATNVTGPWFLYTNLTAGTNGLFELEDPTEPTPPMRFYRTTYP